MSDRFVEVFDVIPEDTPFSFETYWHDEIEYLNPALKKAGYQVFKWRDGERDSFGPLTRIARAIDPEGKPTTLIYG